MQMRPQQKNRNQRNKSGRKPSSGNNANRVYESNGPEGKVRGTPQQVVEKYLQLARDAQSANDRVLAESFFQFAEHYIRVINAAQQQNEERRQQMQPDGVRQDNDGARGDGDGDGDGDDAERGNDGERGNDYGGYTAAQRFIRPEAPQPDAGQRSERPRYEHRVEPDHATPQPQPPIEALAMIDTGDDVAAEPIATPEGHAADETPRPPRRRVRRAAPKAEPTPADPAA